MINRRIPLFPILPVLLALLAACSGAPQAVRQISPTAAAAVVEQAAAVEEEVAGPLPTEAPAAVATIEPTAVPPSEPAPAESQEEALEEESDTAVSTPEPQPVEIVFFTPTQQEGPYYPVEKPADRDGDLVHLAGAPASALGQVLEFGGTVYDAAGLRLERAVVEIWQTDANGVYLHPADPGTESRDRNFQFYGESLTGADGRYSFRTILPGLYEPRPRHIHVKVRLQGEELLTTQFYFAGEIDLQGADAFMLVDTQHSVDEAGNNILLGERDIFLDLNT